MNQLAYLSDLIHKKNALENEIANLIGRPALIGHVGEYIASIILDIELMESASNKSTDGVFRSGLLIGRNVNIKWYGKQESILDLTPNSLPDFYLVMTGPISKQATSRKGTRPWVVEFVYVFNARDLASELIQTGSRVGIATSVPRRFWDQAEIFPNDRSALLSLLPEQKKQLELFKDP